MHCQLLRGGSRISGKEVHVYEGHPIKNETFSIAQ